MAVPKQTHMLSDNQLKEFLTESKTCADVLDSLITTERPRTEVTLSRPGLAPDYVIQMVAVLLKASRSTDTAGVIDLLSVLVGSRFFMTELVATSSALANKTGEYEALALIENLVEILNQIYLRLPSSFTNAFGLIIILQKRTEDMLLTAEGERRLCVTSLSETLAEMRDSVMKRMVSNSRDNPRLPFEKQAPPEDFRNIPILPRVSDIFLESRGAFLRKNKARGGYDNLQHYLDVQFRLYREDCISPLREGITQYVQEVSAGHNVRRLQDGRLYKNVSVQYVEHGVEGQMYKVTLDPEHARRIKWGSSRRLLYGSLLCLSADNFHTMVFAIVEESDRDLLAKDHCFKIVFPTEVGEVRLPLNASFTMVESTAFFEAYRHVLAGLQRLEDGELPFEKYIVNCWKDVDRPLYLNNEHATYDLQPIVSENAIFRGRSHYRPLHVELNRPVSHWPSAEALHLDQSQFEAFHAALTQEFVLIQGPPGTGKTHVGLQIAKALLHNKNVWQSTPSIYHNAFKRMPSKTKDQLLVVCYTNHALDQFMEGIVQFLDDSSKMNWCDEILRVGGRSENEAMQGFSLKTRRRHHRRSQYETQAQEQKLNQLYKSITSQHQHISFVACSLCHLHDTILDVHFLIPFMTKVHANYFVQNNELSPPNKLYQWLEADRTAWVRNSQKVYNRTSQMKMVPSANEKETPETPAVTNVDQPEDDEAKKVENERRIEDEDFSVQFQGHIGLDVNQQIKNVLGNMESKQQLDQHFQSLLQREANMTLTKLKSNDRMDKNETMELKGSLRKLTKERRWQLYRYWVYLYQQDQSLQLPKLEKEYYETIKVYQKEKKEVDAEIIKASTVIGMTTTGAARYHDVLKEIGPRIVIVEEAAEVLEAHIVTALSPRCEHLILIGDHKQLEPKPSVMQLALKYNLSLSMFERMLNNGIKNHCLQRQHRMRPDISKLVRDIYPVLYDNENVFEYEHILGVRKDVFFINHNQPEDYADDIRSYSNKHEARYVAKLCKYLMKQGYEGTQITVLAAYTGQMFCIRDCMPRQEFEGVKTVAIDNFQGEENDIILLSIVRSNKEGKIGFLSRENRICVALSRAKKGLYVIGNFVMFESGNRRWADVVGKVKMAGQFGKSLPLYCQNHPQAEGIQAGNASDFAKSPDGGCELKCDFRLPCGHACRLYCHSIDKAHAEYICKHSCQQNCQNDHLCKRKCHFGEDCDCPIIMTKDLPCGHRADMKCCQSAQAFTCKVIVVRELGCGHSVELECHIDTEKYKCKTLVTRTLEPCSHQADMRCWEDPDTKKCRTVVMRILEKCGHEAEMECCVDILLYQCKFMVKRMLPRCDHEADMECRTDPAVVACAETLTKTRVACGHIYDVRCSKFNILYERRHPCVESVTKSWACPHTKVMKCHESELATCQDTCLIVCDQNHTCRKKCHFPSSCKCDIEMEKILPTCGHTQGIPCHKDPAGVDCRTMVMKRLTTCDHEMMLECSADPSSYLFKTSCDTLVPKTVPFCHHTQTMKCSESPAMYKCKEIIGKPHPRCGHTVQVECSTSPSSSIKCETIISKRMRCGHNRDMTCYESYTSNRLSLFREKSQPDYHCKEDVDHVLPKCGHLVSIPCHVKTRLDQQEITSVMIKRSLPKLPACKTPVLKTFPCGHYATVECGSSALQTCSSNCSKSMSCGHTCTRKCTHCFENLIHGNCIQPCGKRQICGHDCTSQTCGSCKPCSEKCASYCPHRRCEHPCVHGCTPCKEMCPLQCPHHSCSRLCHEECDRPRCDKPCPRLLECKHPCMGYCGDPCPRLCLVCEPDGWSDFNDEWATVGDIRIVRLEDCGHEHGSSYLERLFAREENDLSLLCCPKCEKVIQWHPRYTNRLKKQSENLTVLKRTLAIGLKGLGREPLFPSLCGGVEETRSYLQRFNTYLFFQNELKNRRDPLEMSHRWLMSNTGKLSKFLDSLGKAAATMHQDVPSVNQALTKLSATWLLLVANSRDHDLSSSDSDGEDKFYINRSDSDWNSDFTDVAKHKAQHVIKSKRDDKKKKLTAVTETNAILHAVENIINKSQAFSLSELWEMRQTLGVLLSDPSEVNQVMAFPRLQTIGVHTDDWLICSAGHIGSAVFQGEKCVQCMSGTPLALTYRTFLDKWRGKFEGEQNLSHGGHGSKRSRRGSQRGGNGIERGGPGSERIGRGSERGGSGSGRGWRGSEKSERSSERVHASDGEGILPSGPVYMASPHQANFEQRGRGRGRGGRGEERGGIRWQNSRGRGGYRGGGFGSGWDGGSVAGSRESGIGREGSEGSVWDNRRNVGDSEFGFGREGRGVGRKGDEAFNRRGGFIGAETASVAGYRGGNSGGRGGRGGEYRGRDRGDQGSGRGDRGRGRGDRGRGRGDRGRGSRGRGKGRRQ